MNSVDTYSYHEIVTTVSVFWKWILKTNSVIRLQIRISEEKISLFFALCIGLPTRILKSYKSILILIFYTPLFLILKLNSIINCKVNSSTVKLNIFMNPQYEKNCPVSKVFQGMLKTLGLHLFALFAMLVKFVVITVWNF